MPLTGPPGEFTGTWKAQVAAGLQPGVEPQALIASESGTPNGFPSKTVFTVCEDTRRTTSLWKGATDTSVPRAGYHSNDRSYALERNGRMFGLPVFTLNCVPETVTLVLAATSVRFGRERSREAPKRTRRSSLSDQTRLSAGSTLL